MGLKCSPDIAQEVMENIFRHVKDTDIYIDDVEAFIHKDWENHIQLLDQILGLLTEHGFIVNLLKRKLGSRRQIGWVTG